MTDLSPLCALGAPAPRRVSLGALTLAETPDCGLASLALRRDTPPPSLALPEPGRWQETDGVTAFWTGPGQWLVEMPGCAEVDAAARLAERAPGASVTEQTDGWVLVEITSTAGAAPVERFLERAVNLDLTRFAPGHATRSTVEHLGVYLLRRAEDRLGIWGMRSAAESLWHTLETIAGRLE
ncbi:sarcosine oxidase subunit gamma [Pararhodobacter marinus]|uniref:Sarcosine oxidase subunit gamma n=1 Tax=Pararhodobacter marinus TaxID=2184063 RepID=A0A2U2CCY9_9RHOB|nr:sarcosine oxidase subunit gamma [Pararhodobacter marinus]PWE29712.1 sarcosine oxidase subunit gamma [Pararhodobacter marinus]